MKQSLLFIALATALGAAVDRPALIEEIKQAERDFCASVVKDGAGVAFPAFMAEPSAWGGDIHPDRALARAKVGNRPRRPGVATHWEPVFADVSAAGDLGYAWGNSWVTGLTTPEGQPRQSEGFTFTAWRKQTDGTWKFVMDGGGAATPEAVAAVLEAARVRPMTNSVTTPYPTSVADARRELQALEAAFAQAPDRAAGYLAAAADEAFSVDLAAYGKEQLTTRLHESSTVAVSRETLHADIAASGDLAYTLGLWNQRAKDSPSAGGAYFTMWKRQRDGSWRWVVDNTFTAPPNGPLAEKFAKLRESAAILNR